MVESSKKTWAWFVIEGSTYTWYVPAGVYWLKGLLIGAGGSGGIGSNDYCGGSGGSGGTIIFQSPAIPSENLTITVGQGGSSNSSTPDGTNTQILFNMDQSQLIAGGGIGGGNATSSAGGSAGQGGSFSSVNDRGLFISGYNGQNGYSGTATAGGSSQAPYIPDAFFNGSSTSTGVGSSGAGGGVNLNGSNGYGGLVLIFWGDLL